MSMPLRVLLLVALAAILSGAVDKSKFKTCNESSFCKRHRRIENPPRFSVDPKTVVRKDKTIHADLIRSTDQRKFSLVITGLTDNRLRFTIDEIDGLHKRYTPTDALDGEPEKRAFGEASATGNSMTIFTADGHKIHLRYSPFRVDVYRGKDDLVVSLNARQMMKIEHFREKSEKLENTEEGDGGGWFSSWFSSSNSTAHDTVDEWHDAQTHATDDGESEEETTPKPSTAADDEGDDFWEENFHTHRDAKVRGSSSVGLDIRFTGFDHVYGLPEHADSLALKSTASTDPYRMYNLDVFEYELNSPMALYGANTFMLAHSAARSVGMLWLNAAETWIDVASSTADKGIVRSVVDKIASSSDTALIDAHIMSESGLIDIFVFMGPSPKAVVRQNAKLTGVAPLPPLFSLGYHQCRWNYNDEEDVRQVNAGFDEHDIPMDVIWLDIEHTDGKRYFTWDAQKFGTPLEMQANIASTARKMIVIIDPHIKRDDGYKVYKEAKDADYFVKDRDDREFDGHCWSGSSAYLDFFNPAVRQYWASHFAYDRYEGSSKDLFVWNDMNEPSVFSGPEVTMHKDSKHFGGWEHRDVHNMYGFMHHWSTYEGLKQRSGGQERPFVLTRSFFTGSQRTAAVWTGDNAAEWSHMEASLPMMLSLAVGGLSHVGADVGGFFGNPDEQMLIRWYQTGAFSPFFRAHAHIDARRREPWLFSDATKKHIREAIRRRYALLPFWYTTFAQHERTGDPVIRPMWMEFPEDVHTFDDDKQMMIGSSLLVRPVTQPDVARVSVYLPGAQTIWYDWDTGRGRPGPGAVQVETTLDKIPVYIRGGSIVPTWERVRRSSAVMIRDPLTLRIALDYSRKKASGQVYLDDGHSYAYQKGDYVYRNLTWATEGGYSASLTNVNAEPGNANGKSDVKIEKIIVMGLDFHPQDVHLFTDDYTPTPLEFDFDRQTMLLTIHKPMARLTKEWRVDVHG